MSKPLTFGELEVGDFFVDFPTDGDDSGHGGYRKGAYVFKKCNPTKTAFPSYLENAFRLVDGSKSKFPDTMLVFKVIM
jgi:hypothetical protein